MLTLISLTACEKKAEERAATKGEAPKAADAPPVKKEARPLAKPEGTAKDAPPPALANPPSFRPVDPTKDFFTIGMKTKEMSWTAEGLMSGDVSELSAMGAGPGLDGVKLDIALVTGKAANGVLETKDFGTIKIRSSGGFGAEFQMTEDSIAKVREALKAKH